MKHTISKSIFRIFLIINLLGITIDPIFAQLEVVKIAALRGPTGLGMVKLFQDKPLLNGTIKTEFFSYPSPDVLLPRLLNGEVQIAALPTNVAVNLYNRKVPYVLTAVVGNGVLYCVSTDSSLTQLEKVERLQNVGKGSTPEFILRHILQRRGLEEKVRVEFRFAPMELAQVLIAGRESTGILPEPFATKVLRARKDARIISDLQEEWKALYPETPTYPMSVLVVHSALLKTSRPLVEAFLDLYKQSQNWVKSNPDAAGEIASKLSFGLDQEDAKDAIPRCNLTFVPAKEARSSLEKFLKVLLQFAPESIGGKLPDSDFYAFP